MKKPELRLISKTTEHDLFDDLDQLRVTPEEAAELERARRDRLRREKKRQRHAGSDELDADRPPPQSKPVRDRLPRAEFPFVRVWLPRAVDDRLYAAPARLWHVLLQLSREGRKTVRLTSEVAEAARVAARHKSHLARRLEKLGLVRIERSGQSALNLNVIADPLTRQGAR
jgi:hypothetical protein